jgi:muramidase (phage lysozyme)
MNALLDLLARLFARPAAAQVPQAPHPAVVPTGPTVDVQLHAFQFMLACCEGTAADDGYRYLFGSTASNTVRFDDFAKHPNIRRTYVDLSGKPIITTAAGRYQITFPTYTEFGGGAFDPAAQDAMCAGIIRRCGAMADIEAGRLQAAIDKCAGRWASLPSSKVPQPHRSFAYAKAAFERAGGKATV